MLGESSLPSPEVSCLSRQMWEPPDDCPSLSSQMFCYIPLSIRRHSGSCANQGTPRTPGLLEVHPATPSIPASSGPGGTQPVPSVECAVPVAHTAELKRSVLHKMLMSPGTFLGCSLIQHSCDRSLSLHGTTRFRQQEHLATHCQRAETSAVMLGACVSHRTHAPSSRICC